MGKRNATNETKEEKRARKRLKKESKEKKKHKNEKEHHDNVDKNVAVDSKKKKKTKKSPRSSKDDSGSRNRKEDERRSVVAPVDKTSSSSKTTTKCSTILWKKQLHLVVSLLPSTLGRSYKCIEDSLRLLLLKHSDSVGGILLAFDKVTILSDKNGGKNGSQGQGRGWILNELPYIHYNVSCDALVFKPTIGCTVRVVSFAFFHFHFHGHFAFCVFNFVVVVRFFGFVCYRYSLSQVGNCHLCFFFLHSSFC